MQHIQQKIIKHYEITLHKKLDKDKISKEMLCLQAGFP